MTDKKEAVNTPQQIYKEYEEAKSFKSSIGENGLYEQCKMNERFLLGDQWNGAETGDLPKPVMNVLKQIGDFKVSNIVSNPITAVYEFDGVPTYLEAQTSPDLDELQNVMQSVNGAQMPQTGEQPEITFEEEHVAVATALTAHFRSVWERCKMDKLNQTGIRKAYMHGACVLYSYFNPELKTGLYADLSRSAPVKGDIEVEILDISNVYFCDPSETDVQRQPFVIITQRKTLDSIKRMMRLNNRSQAEIDELKADEEDDNLGNYSDDSSIKKFATLITKFWRDDESGNIKAIPKMRKCIVRSLPMQKPEMMLMKFKGKPSVKKGAKRSGSLQNSTKRKTNTPRTNNQIDFSSP